MIARGWDGRLDNYRYDRNSGTFIGPNGGTIIPTGELDVLGNPVFRRINAAGKPGAHLTVSFNENGQAVQGSVIKNQLFENQTATSELHRPYLRTQTQGVIFNGYKRLENGDYEDIYGNIIRGPIDIGHIPGYEHRRLVLAANQKGMTQQQFNDFVNSHPEYFRLENSKINRGHSGEKTGIDDIESIIRDINKFFEQGK